VEDLKQFFVPGTLIALPCPDPEAGLATIKSECDRLRIRVVTLHWTFVGSVGDLLDETLKGLARIALALWPNWYEQLIPAHDSSRPGRRQQLSPQWREIAEQYCSAGQLPLPRGYAAAEHATQLSLTLAASDLAIVMAVDEVNDASAQILRAAGEWLTSNTASSVTILLRGSTTQSKLRQVFKWDERFLGVADFGHFPTEDTEPRIDLCPVIGAPHPLSPGEQRLAQQLLADAELGPLFAFNQRITGRHGNAYIVDLVWPDGKFIVEVDSFHLHGNRFAFANDRHRDYELLASDYRVLRITHDEAAHDTPSAVGKIRQVVKLIRESANSKQGVRL
jgi:very-short-patch-repair endonuclease